MRKSMTYGFVGLGMLAMAMLTQPAAAGSVTTGSEGSVTALGHVVQGGATAVRGSGEFAVVSVSTVGKGVVVVLKNLSTGADVALNVTGHGVAGIAKWTGETLKSFATSAGVILASGTTVVLFVPAVTAMTLFHAESY